MLTTGRKNMINHGKIINHGITSITEKQTHDTKKRICNVH